MDKHHDPVTSGTRRQPKLAELTGEWAVWNALASRRPFACEQFLVREWRRFCKDTCRPQEDGNRDNNGEQDRVHHAQRRDRKNEPHGHFQTLLMSYNLPCLSIFDQGAVTTNLISALASFIGAGARRRMTARWSASALAILALHAPHGTAAQAATALPDFTACVPAAAPVLPERWRAVGLLFPFLRQQLEVGEFVYDGSLPVLRATIYGLEYGAVDLLITDNGTYQLSGPSEAPTACTTLGRKYTPPTRQWIGGGAVCDGEAAIATKRVQWWKTPSSDGRTNWQWYSADTQLPWRI